MSYTPPSGGSVNLDLTPGYTAPNGGAVNLEFDATVVADIRVVTIGTSAGAGLPTIFQYPRVAASSTDSMAFGQLLIQSDVPRIYPLGIDNTIVVSTPEYVRWRQFVDLAGLGFEYPNWPLGTGRVRLAGGYNPPPASNVILNWFDLSYSVPPASNVVIDFGALGYGYVQGATLFDQSGFGLTTVSQPLGATVAGISSTVVFGTANIALFISTLRPSGFSDAAYGSVTITLGAAGIAPGGIAPPPQSGPNANRQLPDPYIDFRIRYLLPAGIAVPIDQISPVHYIAQEIQYIDLAGIALDSWSPGEYTIDFGQRYIEPYFISSLIFGSAVVARTQIVYPTGFDESFISENHQLDINLQRLIQNGGEADPTEYGVTHVRNEFEILAPTGWLSQDLIPPIVYNFDQHLQVGAYQDTTGDPTGWAQYAPYVENKIRTLNPGGFQSSRFSIIGNIVRNNAEAVVPEGFDATLWGPESFIGHYIRYVYPDPWDSFYNTHYTVVYNDARIVAPTGWKSDSTGTPSSVVNANRTVTQIFPYEGPLVGTAFIADQVRTLAPNLVIEPPSGFPEVRHNPHPLAPTGIAPPQFGGHTVYEHFNILFPKSANVHSVPWVGEPFIQNRNKTLFVYPSVQTLYGLAHVNNYIQNVEGIGYSLTVWGSHLISRRTKDIFPAPIGVPIFSVAHRIKNDIPDPPSDQRVLPLGMYIGLEGNPGIIPTPTVRTPTIYPEGLYDARLGVPIILRNTIEVPPGIFNLDQVGIPSLNDTQYMFPKSVPWPAPAGMGESDLFEAKPRLSPHTIYAPEGDQATPQARLNHPADGTKIDQFLVNSYGPAWPVFGRSEVSNQYRAIYPTGVLGTEGPSWSSRFGSADFQLRKRYVYPYPVRSLRFGFVVFLNVAQYVTLDIDHNGIDSQLFGDQTVGFPPYATDPNIKPTGSVLTLWGATRIELFNREVAPEGIRHSGNPEQSLTSPWGLPLVGYPREYIWSAGVLTLWGDARVEHYTRGVYASGWESLSLIEDDLGHFSDRMRVTRRNPEDGIPSVGTGAVFGVPGIMLYNREIIGRGIAGYNSGAHIIEAKYEIAATGWDSSVFGDIDRWEAGKIKAHGDDLSLMGTPRMMRSIQQLYEEFEPGPQDHRLAFVISALGLPPIGFDGPSLTDEFGCNNRVVVPFPILPPTFPQPAYIDDIYHTGDPPTDGG